MAGTPQQLKRSPGYLERRANDDIAAPVASRLQFLICACQDSTEHIENQSWMGGRVVEGTGLENRQTRKRLEGSNPSPSARNRSFTRRCAAFSFAAQSSTPVVFGAPGKSLVALKESLVATGPTVKKRPLRLP